MRKYLNYIFIIIFIYFITTYQFDIIPELFVNKNINISRNVKKNKRIIDIMENRVLKLSKNLNNMYNSISENDIYSNLGLTKKNKEKQIYSGYKIIEFSEIDIDYNKKNPFSIYSKIIGNNKNKNTGSLTNIDDQIIRSYNTTKKKYTELQKHINNLNNM